LGERGGEVDARDRLPSAARALVRMMTRGARALEKRRAVRIVRNASATAESGSWSTIRSSHASPPTGRAGSACPFVSGRGSAASAWRTSVKFGMVARVGMRRRSSTSALLRTLWSKYSRPNAAPSPTTSPAAMPSARFNGIFGRLG
jgi:hypothetical protein